MATPEEEAINAKVLEQTRQAERAGNAAAPNTSTATDQRAALTAAAGAQQAAAGAAGAAGATAEPTAPGVTPVTPVTAAAPISTAERTQPGVEPVSREVKPEETVEERLNRLTAGGSKYIEQARSGAQRAAGRRGLINTSMAAGAGEEAAIGAALPIAQQDAATLSEAAKINQQATNEFRRNEQSANLNMEMAALDNILGMEKEAFSAKLKTDMEKTLSDAKFSDEMKLQFVSTINNVIRDTQQQITDIGLSDRSAAQQATAIQLAMDNRDATVAVYQNLIGNSADWDWGTQFTPENVYTPPPPQGMFNNIGFMGGPGASANTVGGATMPPGAFPTGGGGYQYQGDYYDANGNRISG